jgi:hypothetical protein
VLAIAGPPVAPLRTLTDFVDRCVENGRAFGLEGKSGRVTFRLLHVFELRDGLISAESVWSGIVAIADAVE